MLWLVPGAVVAVGVHAAAQLGVARALGVRPLYIAPRSARRAAALFVGIVGNFVAAILFVFGSVWAGGLTVGLPVVHETPAGGASEGRLYRGDVIWAIDGELCPARRLAECVNKSGGRNVLVDVERGGRRHLVDVSPRFDQGRWRLGIAVGVAWRRAEVDAGSAASAALAYPFQKTASLALTLWDRVFAEEKPYIAGPVKVVRWQPTSADKVEIVAYLQVVAGFILLAVDALLFAVARRRRDLPPRGPLVN